MTTKRCPPAPPETLHGLSRRFSPANLRRERFRRAMGKAVWAGLVLPLLKMQRMTDVFFAVCLMAFFAPVFLLLWVVCGKPTAQNHVGRWCEPFAEWRFSTPRFSALRPLFSPFFLRLPVLFNILKGDMAFVGPRPVLPGELSPRERAARRRYDVRPGLICLWWIRQRTNIAYEPEACADLEYVEGQSFGSDLGIALRALPAVFYGGAAPVAAPDSVTLLNIPIDNVTMQEAVETLAEWATDTAAPPRRVCFVNADCANIAYRDADYRRTVQTADLTLADGIGMKIAGKLLGREIKQNVNGTDLFPRLCAALENTDRGIFLLGAGPGVGDNVRNWVLEHYPGVLVSGVQHGFFAPDDEAAVCAQIKQSGAALLLVAFGAPRQDKWIARHLADCGVPVAVGVGGLFDFFGGSKPRAPQWVRELGLEWGFRLLTEPSRLAKRYLIGNSVFLLRVFKERFTRAASTLDAAAFEKE